MIINELNGEVINTKVVYVHDDELVCMKFESANKNLQLDFYKKGDKNQKYRIVFLNVIGFEMTNCDYWGASECVLDFEYISKGERALIPKLESQWRDNFNNSISYDNYIESMITFTSGDKWTIACKSIEYVQ